MGKESYKKCDEIIKKLFENRESQEFRAPVDYVRNTHLQETSASTTTQ